MEACVNSRPNRVGVIMFCFVQAFINTNASAVDPTYLGVIWVTKAGEQVDRIEIRNIFEHDQVLEAVQVVHFTIQFAGGS